MSGNIDWSQLSTKVQRDAAAAEAAKPVVPTMEELQAKMLELQAQMQALLDAQKAG